MGEPIMYSEKERICDICGSNNTKHVRTKPIACPEKTIKDGDKTFHATDVMCMDCGLIYKNPSLDQESLNKFYLEEYTKLYSPSMILGIPKNEILVRAVDAVYFMEWTKKISLDIKNKRILNIGSGMGVLSYFLESYGAMVTSVEPIRRICEIAKKIFGIDAINVYFDDYCTSNNNKFDIIIFQNSLEHLYSAKEAISNARQMLNDNGMLIIEVPDIFYPYPYASIDSWFSSAHTFSFSESSIRNLLYASGMQIKHLDHDGDKKKMLIVAVNDSSLEIAILKDYTGKQEIQYNKLMEMMREVDLTHVNYDKYRKELFNGKDVIAIGQDIVKNLYYTYNSIVLRLLGDLVGSNKDAHAAALMKVAKFRSDLMSDFGCNEGTILYYKAILSRKNGDILLFKELINEAMQHYPPMDQYNIITFMKMNGLLSDSLFSRYDYGNTKKLQESIA